MMFKKIPIEEKVLILTPNSIEEIKQYRTVSIDFGVYINGVLQADIVTVTPSGASDNYYNISTTSNNAQIECLNPTEDDLVLTFESGSLIEHMTIQLNGFL